MTEGNWRRGLAAGILATCFAFGATGCSPSSTGASADAGDSSDGGGILSLSQLGGPLHLFGPEGGPFPQGTRTYRLKNEGTGPIAWRMEGNDSWLNATPIGGYLLPGGSEPITVEINHTVANALPEGEYPAELVFRDLSGPQGEVYMGFDLHVLPPGGSALRLHPASGLVIHTDTNAPQGAVDGEIEVENSGSLPFVWTASSPDAWIQVQHPTETRFNPGEMDMFGIGIDEALLATQGFGTHVGTVRVMDAANPTTTFLDLSVTVHLAQTTNGRVTANLQAEYRFDQGAGNVIHDVSGVQPSMDLVINNMNDVAWQPGGLQIVNPTLIATPGPATRLTNSMRSAGQATVEAWIRPANTNQEGPARIVGISNGPSLRNFTLGQGLWGGQPSDTFNMRARSTTTNMDGMPMLTTGPGVATTGLQHVVYTFAPDGNETLYVNGQVVAQQYKGGNLSNWDPSYRLALGNEIGSSRPWLGEVFLMAMYDRALSHGEIQQNLNAGSGASNSGHLNVSPGSDLYVTAVRGQGPIGTVQDFVLANVGGESLQWTAYVDQAWFQFPNSQGNLNPAQTTTLPVNLNASAIAALPAGQFTANVLIRNDTSQYGSRLTRVNLNVVEPGSSGSGIRPGPTNTGPSNPSILQNVGGMTITQDGAVIENVRVFGVIDVRANNVTIRNFVIDAGNQPYAIKCNNGTYGTVIEDGELFNVNSAHIIGSGFSAFRLNMHHSGGDGFKASSDALVEGCWVHHLGTNPGSHADCDQTRQGGNLIFRGNYMDLPVDIGAPYKQNACWIIQTGDGPIDNVLIENNWINGGNYSIFVENKHDTNPSLPDYGDPTNVRILNNRFMRDFRFGPLRATSYALVSGNRWDDNDQLMNINNQ